MRNYVLDTSVIIRDPGLLLRGSNDVRIVVPRAAVDELAFRSILNSDLKAVKEFVDQTLKDHADIRLIDAEDSDYSSLGLPSTRRLVSSEDIRILIATRDFAKKLDKTETVFLVTTDRPLAELAEKIGLRSLNYQELKLRLEKVPTSTETAANQGTAIGTRYRRVEVRRLVRESAIGIIATLFGGLISSYYSAIISSVRIWGTCFIVLIVGFSLYWWRSKSRFSYGVSEFLFGWFVALSVFFPDFDYNRVEPVDFLKILTGIYVIVRGLDNIGTGLENTRFGPRWKTIF